MKAAAATAIAELRQWPHWVVWRQETRDGKTTKVPCVATSPRKHASSTDPDTWATYEVAAQTVQRGGAAGVGYVFTPHDEYTGVDLDKCVEVSVSNGVCTRCGSGVLQSGEHIRDDLPPCRGRPTIHPGALEIVDRLDSYTELSPTGTGLHIFVRGRINGDRNRTGKTPWGGEFESYDQGRYFTVTEQHLEGTPTTIEARQDELDAIRAELFPPPVEQPQRPSSGDGIDDIDELFERARNAKNGRDFEALYSGDTGRHGDDESAADLALCNMLAFWAGPHPERIDSLFRRSGLMRDKWDSPRGTTTYGRITVDKALEGRTEFFSPNGGKPMAAAEMEIKFRSASDQLAAMCALIDDPFVECWRSGHGSDHRYVLRTRSGRTLNLDPLKSYTTAPKMNAEIAVQLSTEPEIKAGANITRFLRLIGQACELREEMTTDDRVRNLMTSFVQEAPTQQTDMEDQVARTQMFRLLRDKDILSEAKSEGVSISTKAVVLVDERTGTRYVKQAWFHAYLKAHLGPGAAEHAGNRLKLHGWDWRGKDGRWKATPADGGKPLIETFYDVSADWE